jgi:hypothetical protein
LKSAFPEQKKKFVNRRGAKKKLMGEVVMKTLLRRREASQRVDISSAARP